MSAIAPFLNTSSIDNAQSRTEFGYEITSFAQDQPLPLIITTDEKKNINAIGGEARALHRFLLV